MPSNTAYFDKVEKTADVGSRPAAVSWVGALDMSGNVWEWTSSLYQPYPYNADDGRENTSDTNSMRVLRGGGSYSFEYGVRAASRNWNNPDAKDANKGFRCARAYN